MSHFFSSFPWKLPPDQLGYLRNLVKIEDLPCAGYDAFLLNWVLTTFHVDGIWKIWKMNKFRVKIIINFDCADQHQPTSSIRWRMRLYVIRWNEYEVKRSIGDLWEFDKVGVLPDSSVDLCRQKYLKYVVKKSDKYHENEGWRMRELLPILKHGSMDVW